MNIVMIDSDKLAGEADFPLLDLPKFGWQQYPALTGSDIAERCWRADIIITVSTPVDRDVIDQAFKLKLIVAAGNDTGHIDLQAARERGIQVCNVPGRDPNDALQSRAICSEVIAAIDAYIKQAEKHVAG